MTTISSPRHSLTSGVRVQSRKRERLYVADLVETPVVTYPAWYRLSAALLKNEILHDALRAIHCYDFENYTIASSHEAIFTALESGYFAIYKERYAVGYFGGKLMYLESQGWKSFPVTREIFLLDNWMI